MCKTCDDIITIFKDDGLSGPSHYFEVLRLLEVKDWNTDLELVAGDCPFDETEAIIQSEERLTICHFFQCRFCFKRFFMGCFIRGEPIFDVLDKFDKNDINRLHWGREGSFFSDVTPSKNVFKR